MTQISGKIAASSLVIEAPPTNSNAGGVAAGVVVSLIAVAGIGSGVAGAIGAIVYVLKKKAAVATAKEITAAQHVDVELVEGL